MESGVGFAMKAWHLRLLFAAWLLTTANALAAELPAGVAQALLRADIPTSHVAAWVQPVDASAPSLSVNANQPMNPASVMKLVTAFAALDRLGPSHTWPTRFATNATLVNGRLEGDLFIVGGADPVLNYERMWRLLRRLRAMGVDTIDGNIVLDGSALSLPAHDPDAFDGRGLRPYNSAGYGLLLHFNTLQLFLEPGKAGEAVSVVSSPPVNGLRIDNRLLSQPGNCGVWHRNLDSRLELDASGPSLMLTGGLPASCGARNWAAAPLPPERFAQAVVTALWAETGGKLSGSVVSGKTPQDARQLLRDDSPALAEVVREMNKWSSNVIARQMLASLGQLESGALDMVAAGARIAAESLADAGVDTRGLVIENGSGLSRIERIRADSLGNMLIAAWREPWMPEFIASLPMAGVDGTAHRRLRNSDARGQAHIKTGTINQVRAIGGYVLDRHGRRHAVVMMVNHANAGRSQPAQDALLEWVWQGSR